MTAIRKHPKLTEAWNRRIHLNKEGDELVELSWRLRALADGILREAKDLARKAAELEEKASQMKDLNHTGSGYKLTPEGMVLSFKGQIMVLESKSLEESAKLQQANASILYNKGQILKLEGEISWFQAVVDVHGANTSWRWSAPREFPDGICAIQLTDGMEIYGV